jgi:ketosteroid isomerase-like protein
MRPAARITLIACLVAGLVIEADPSAVADDLPPAESAVLQSDTAWAAAANTGNVDAWMAFCSTDAIVLLPHEPLSSGVRTVREAVKNLMGLGHFALQWHFTKIEMAPAGDLAQVLGTYELDHTGPDGAPVTERGTRLEIWRKQADGSWKAIVDGWISASSPGIPSAAAPPPATIPAVATRYGDAPVNYVQTIRGYFQEHLKDPESLQYGEVTVPEQGSMKGTTGTFLMSESRDYGWIVKASVNARNSGGRYVGFKRYEFLFRGEKLVRAAAPLPEGEAN